MRVASGGRGGAGRPACPFRHATIFPKRRQDHDAGSPTTLTLDQIKEAADAGVKLALESRTTALTDGEARETNGGILPDPLLMGFFVSQV